MFKSCINNILEYECSKCGYLNLHANYYYFFYIYNCKNRNMLNNIIDRLSLSINKKKNSILDAKKYM